MVGKLLLEGDKHRVYILGDGDNSEVEDLLFSESRNKKQRSAARNFLSRLEHAADRGFSDLPKEWRDCWKEPKGQFCEFKAGSYRISYFYHSGDRVLLATWFRKKKQVERKQYKRAVELNSVFQQNPVWEE